MGYVEYKITKYLLICINSYGISAMFLYDDNLLYDICVTYDVPIRNLKSLNNNISYYYEKNNNMCKMLINYNSEDCTILIKELNCYIDNNNYICSYFLNLLKQIRTNEEIENEFNFYF